jgi:hypothetical protein
LLKIKTPLPKQWRYSMQGKLDSALHLVGTEASCTCVHMARSTVDNGLDSLHIGLPSPVGTSVGVGNLNTEGNALATIITLRHTTAPPICIIKSVQICVFAQSLEYYSRVCSKMQVFFIKNLLF